MDIAAAQAEIIPEVEERLVLIAGGGPIAMLSAAFEEIGNLLEALALCYLLDAANVDLLAEYLVRSGHARRSFLRRAQAESDTADRRLALSRTTAFLAAVAAGDLEVGRDIAHLSLPRWQPTWEYEDDFCFFLFVHSIVLDPRAFPHRAHADLLDRFERALEGGSSARLALGRALVAKDAKGAAAAIAARLDEQAAELAVERQTVAVLEGDPAYWPRSYVSIEGLALLRIAELVGVPVTGELPRCPALARLPVRPSFHRDFFAEIERG